MTQDIAGFRKIGIIGAGQMGSGISQVCATHGLHVVMVDNSISQLETAKTNIKASLEKLSQKGVLTKEQFQNGLDKLSFSADMDSLSHCDLVIEAIVENETAKSHLFKDV